MTCGGGEQRGNQTYGSTDLHTLDGQLRLALLQQIPAAHTHAEDGTYDPGGGDGVAELRDGEGGEGYLEE